MINTIDVLNVAAEYIAKLDTSRWAERAVYLLEVLEGKTDPDTFTGLLEELRGSIDTRLQKGDW